MDDHEYLIIKVPVRPLNGPKGVSLDQDDVQFIERMLNTIEYGSQGIFVLLHPNERMQFMLLNCSSKTGPALLERAKQRILRQSE